MAGLAVGGTVEQAVEVVVGLGFAVAHLGLPAENFFKHQLGHEAAELGAGDLYGLDFLRHIAFFVGQEEPQVAVAVDEVFALQAFQAFRDAALEGQFVGVDLGQAQGGQVVYRAFDGVCIADEKERAQQLDVVELVCTFLQAGVVGGLVDGALDGGLQERFDGRIEVVQRDECVGTPMPVDEGSGLERIEHGALALGKVHARSAYLADGLEHLLQQLELIRRKGVVGGEVFGALDALEGGGVVRKRELVVDDVGLGRPDGLQGRLGLGGFFEQAVGNHLVGVGAGQQQPGVEAPLNLGEILPSGLAALAQGGVNVGLAGDDDPRPALALGAQLLGDGLQVEHELGVVADELAHLVHQEHHAVLRPFALQVGVDQRGEAFDVDLVALTGVVKPLASRVFGHAQRLA